MRYYDNSRLIGEGWKTCKSCSYFILKSAKIIRQFRIRHNTEAFDT